MQFSTVFVICQEHFLRRKRFAARKRVYLYCRKRPLWRKGRKEFMKKYVCSVCGWIYDEAEGAPDNGIAPGTKWEALPDDFVCPLCGVGKDQFEEG